MKNFGPFPSYADALEAACPMILSKPNAVVGFTQASNPELVRRTATEYCGWLYYTPAHLYELSMLTDRSASDDVVTGRKSCDLPAFVNDARYASSDLKYIIALHNHPFGTQVSERDVRFIEAMASVHEWVITTRSHGQVLLSIVAFFSRSSNLGVPTCDGFYQYIPATRSMVRWTRAQGKWKHELIALPASIRSNGSR
jgi:hypothetical protein